MVDIKRLEEISKQLKIDTVESVYQAKSGHIGGSLSAADFITVLYFYKMRINPQDPHWEDRDRFVLSKGHSAPVLYAALARRGFFNVDELNKLRQIDSHLQGAPNLHTPGIDMSSGPLGQGLSAAVGMALAGKINKKDYHVYCMIGDGELQEGQIWEAAMAASKYKLNNLIAILDYNKVQMSGTVDELMPMGNVEEKFKSFGWETYNIDGHSIKEIIEVLDLVTSDNTITKPVMIISRTIKGKSVSFMEGKYSWHGAVPSNEEFHQAIEEIKEGTK